MRPAERSAALPAARALRNCIGVRRVRQLEAICMFACTRVRVRLQVQTIVGSVVVWSWACVRAQPIYRNKAIRSGGSGGDARTSDVRSCSAATRARRVAVGANRRRTAGGAQAPCFHSHVTDSTWRNPAASLANAVAQPRALHLSRDGAELGRKPRGEDAHAAGPVPGLPLADVATSECGAILCCHSAVHD
jgi:hypothetical protein